MIPALITLGVLASLIVLLAVYDLVQKKHAILRNFPVIGHLRYLLEMIGPELRQYIVTDNDSERPFSRDQRRWVYASSKKENNYFGFPEQSILALALGCDLIHVGREAMLAIGCIQAQRCHTGHCPAGVATHNAWLMRGLDPTLKSARLANYIVTLRKELRAVGCSVGVAHPAEITPDHIEILDPGLRSRGLAELFCPQC